MNAAEEFRDMLEQVCGLFAKFDVEKGDWLTLAFKLAIDGGHLRLPSPAGAPPHTPFDNISIWARVQKRRDDGPKKPNGDPKLSQRQAGDAVGVSKSALNRATQCPLTQAIISARRLMGADEFWKSAWREPDDGPPGYWWDVARKRKEWTPGFKRYIASGSYRHPTLLGSKSETSR